MDSVSMDPSHIILVMALMIVVLIAITTVMVILVGFGAWNRIGQMQLHIEQMEQRMEWHMLDKEHDNFVRELWNSRDRLRPLMRPNYPSDEGLKATSEKKEE